MKIEKIAIIENNLFDLEVKIKKLSNTFKYHENKIKLNNINKKFEIFTEWNNFDLVKKLNKEKKMLENNINCINLFFNDFLNIKKSFFNLYDKNDNNKYYVCKRNIFNLNEKIKKFEFKNLFFNEIDKNNAFMDIKSGVGGTESCDWSLILLRQYLRYCERKKFKTKILYQSDGDVVGIKNVTIKIEGDYVFGFLRTETGIHRLVRKSPFNSTGERHTSFSSVFVYPEISNRIVVNINSKDLRIDTYKSSGAGGQHVNKTDSAVRITHIPTKIVVKCQNDRSQHRNRAEAMKILRSRLYDMELRKNKYNKSKKQFDKKNISWGNQIRSYILDRNYIKDIRNNVIVNNIKDVLDGNLDIFIESNLKKGF